jgi:Zn-finger nucleic acid-binding protein
MSTRTGPMACPVDQTPLVMSDRQGIEIDYCPNCRGVWLDRGELDKIIERSAAPGGGAASVPPQQQPGYGGPPPQQGYGAPPPGGHWQPQHRPGHHSDDYYKGHGYNRKKSWLSEIFD